MPVAIRARVVPRAKEGLVGVTANDTSVGGVTLSVAEPLVEPEVAVMVAPPTLCPVANPLPAMVATAVADELQLAALVRFCVLPSL